jgi:flagellar biosynthesis protein FlhB
VIKIVLVFVTLFAVLCIGWYSFKKLSVEKRYELANNAWTPSFLLIVTASILFFIVHLF